MYIASRISFHARRLHLSFGRYNPWAVVWQKLFTLAQIKKGEGNVMIKHIKREWNIIKKEKIND